MNDHRSEAEIRAVADDRLDPDLYGDAAIVTAVTLRSLDARVGGLPSKADLVILPKTALLGSA